MTCSTVSCSSGPQEVPIVAQAEQIARVVARQAGCARRTPRAGASASATTPSAARGQAVRTHGYLPRARAGRRHAQLRLHRGRQQGHRLPHQHGRRLRQQPLEVRRAGAGDQRDQAHRHRHVLDPVDLRPAGPRVDPGLPRRQRWPGGGGRHHRLRQVGPSRDPHGRAQPQSGGGPCRNLRTRTVWGLMPRFVSNRPLRGPRRRTGGRRRWACHHRPASALSAPSAVVLAADLAVAAQSQEKQRPKDTMALRVPTPHGQPPVWYWQGPSATPRMQHGRCHGGSGWGLCAPGFSLCSHP